MQKWLEMRKKDRDDIDKNKNQISAIASFLQSLIQLPETDAVPPTPNLIDNDHPFETPKHTIRHVLAETPFSDIKDEEEVEGGDDDVEGVQGEGLTVIWLVLT